MKTKILAVCCVFLLAAALVLGWKYISVREERNFLQTNIDAQFAFNSVSLYTNLFNTKNWDEETISELNGDAKMCSSLFTCSSYSKNKALQSIVLSMTEMVPPNAQYQIITDRELLDDIRYLLNRINETDAEKLAESAWARMSSELLSVS